MKKNIERLPFWLKRNVVIGSGFKSVTHILDKYRLNTICFEAKCPNKSECFAKKEVTFIIGGRHCTRNCHYCNVEEAKAVPDAIEHDEPIRIAEAVSKLGLKYAVITSVTRDDLPDGGASHFVNVCDEIKKMNPQTRVELLIPDFKGDAKSLLTLLKSKSDIIGHNIEVAGRELFKSLRPSGDFDTSLNVLNTIAEQKGNAKSGFMLGFGESHADIISTMEELYKSGVRLLTMGQYLRPSKTSFPVVKYYSPAEFRKLEDAALKMGFSFVKSGPFVRSSYKAGDFFEK